MTKRTTVPTFTATIYTGAHKGIEARSIIQRYVDEVGLCLTITETEFIYTGGHEKGYAVGLINYPRFSAEPRDIKKKALCLAHRLRKGLGQTRVSVVCSDETIMLGPID